MNNTNKRGKKYIEIAISILASACLFAACSSKKELPKASYSYGPELGLASGNVDLSGDDPDINISDIKSPVGANIDFLSGVVVMNEENYEDLQIWADASTIDIFTPGDYKATYTFNYNGKSISKEINVTIVEVETTEPELSEDNNTPSNSQDTSETETQNPSGNNDDNPDVSNPTTTENKTDSGCISTPEITTSSSSSSTTKPTTTKPSTEQTTKPVQTTKPTQTTKPVQTTKPTSTKKPSSGQTTTKKETTTKKDSTTREIITTKSNTTTANKYIGNYTIELLSGKTITVKNTTSKYIVSTRTETSETTRNGVKYKVSKLIIRYNTGAEQILEIVEEKIG